MVRAAALLFPLLAVQIACAQTHPPPVAGIGTAADMMALVRADNWAAADALAAQSADPVARKLVTFWRLLAPHAATASEIAAFMASNPDWPLGSVLARRRDEAIVTEPDDAIAATVCDGAKPAVAVADARLRCADAYARLNRSADAASWVRAAWIDGPSDADWETRFMQKRGAGITQDDQWTRFEKLAWSDVPGARRQAARVDPVSRPLTEMRLAFKRDDPAAASMFASLPAQVPADAGLFLDRVRSLRRTSKEAEAVALWASDGEASEREAGPSHLQAFWDERSLLARRRLRAGDAEAAYAMAHDAAQQAPEQIADTEFLSGFIALRRLNDPARAAPHFAAVARVSKAAITQSRANYWLARAATARDDATGATAAYREASAYPNTYYGQLASIALGDGAALSSRIATARDPATDSARALAFAGGELARAASLAAAWGDPRRSSAFLVRLAEAAADPLDRALAARLASALGLPNAAVSIARRAGRDGVVLLETGWPSAVDVPGDSGVDIAFSLGIIRQESSFDTQTMSPVGARGLMQLMPATAAEMSAQLGLAVSVAALNTDPAYNMRLGTAYLRKMLDRYDGSIPLAAAAYNAGPNRVAEWLAANGDPRTPGVDMIDWIEMIPLGETRNYVQRVIENTVIYRAARGQPDPHPLARWLR